MHYKKHAKEVVTRFKRMLDPDIVEAMTDDHFDELEMLIAAALGVVESQSKHDDAHKVSDLAKAIKKEGDRVDSNYLDLEDYLNDKGKS